jgi:hypothetical protein
MAVHFVPQKRRQEIIRTFRELKTVSATAGTLGTSNRIVTYVLKDAGIEYGRLREVVKKWLCPCCRYKNLQPNCIVCQAKGRGYILGNPVASRAEKDANTSRESLPAIREYATHRSARAITWS